jgi:nucleolar GTP-binding protein
MARRGPAQRRPRAGGERPPPASIEILDIAFHRADLSNPKGRTKAERDRHRAELKVVRSAATVIRLLQTETRRFRRPPLTDFERALIARRFGEGTLERSLTRVGRAVDRIRGLQRDSERAVHGAAGADELGVEVRRFYGRMASHVREVDADLARLKEIDRYRDDRPRLDPAAPTLVVAGFPNVGKSSLVARLSSAHPKVADYPFTTLAIAVGHADLGFDRWQVLDTPGVLGRSHRANPAEAEAKTAVEQVASVILFVLDPTSEADPPLEEQEQLLARWKEELPGRPIIEVETKSDITRRPRSPRLQVSATTGDGIDALWERIRQLAATLPPREPTPPSDDGNEPTDEERSRTTAYRGRHSSH